MVKLGGMRVGSPRSMKPITCVILRAGVASIGRSGFFYVNPESDSEFSCTYRSFHAV